MYNIRVLVRTIRPARDGITYAGCGYPRLLDGCEAGRVRDKKPFVRVTEC